MEIAYILFIADDVLLGLTSAVVLLMVICKRQNKEPFMILIPVIMLVSVLSIAPHHIAYLFYDYKFDRYFTMLKINQVLSMTSHWLFASQYFKTSIIFPRIFTMVDLEISVDSRENSQSSMTGIDTSKIESKLIEHGFEDVSKSKI